jgi:hypothetical protein
MVKRFLSIAVLGLTWAALSMTPAMAAPPEPADATFEIDAACQFPVLVEVTGKTKTIEHKGSTTFISPNQRATLTNIETGESVIYVITGVLRETPTATGVVLRFTGHNLVFGPDIEGILVLTGSHTFVAVGPSPEEATVTLTESHGTVVNVCDVLAP